MNLNYPLLKMSMEERNRLLGEIEQQKAQVSAMRSNVQTKKTEMDKLKAEVDNANRNGPMGGGNGHLPGEFNGPDDSTNARVGEFMEEVNSEV